MAGNYPQRFGAGTPFPRRYPAPSQNPQHASSNRHPNPYYPLNPGGQNDGGMDRLGIFAQFDSSNANSGTQSTSSESEQSISSTSSATNNSQAYASSSASNTQTVKSSSCVSQKQGPDEQSSVDHNEIPGSPKTSGKDKEDSKKEANDDSVERADYLIRGAKTGTSLSDFLNSKKGKKFGAAIGPSATVSKVSLSEFIWDRDSGKSWDDIKLKDKFGLADDEFGFHMINMDQSRGDEKADLKSIESGLANELQSVVAVNQSKKTGSVTSGQSKGSMTQTDQSKHDVTQTGQSAMDAEEISLSDFIWDHESGKSWEAIKEKFGLTSDESVLLPVKGQGDSGTDTNRSRSGAPLKRAVVDNKQSDAGRPKVPRASDANSMSSSNQLGSREPLKRKPGSGSVDGAKKPRLVTQGNNGKSNPKFIIGNVFVGIKKPMIESLFEDVEGIISWGLMRHKTARATGSVCIMVEMASESMGQTFMAKFKGTKIEKRLVYVRAWNSKDEAMYDPDPNIKSDPIAVEPEIESPITDDSTVNEPAVADETSEEDKTKLLVGNLPANVKKRQLDNLLSYTHGVMSYRLRQNKDDRHDLAVIVEMATEFSCRNLLKVLSCSEIEGQQITCRYVTPQDEQIYIGESWNTWMEVKKQKKEVKKPQKEVKKPQKEVKQQQKEVKKSQESKKQQEEVRKSEQPGKRAVVLISNLPPDSSKADLIDYISDLMYKSVDFYAGELTPNKPAKPSYAYVHFNKQDDAKKMVSELQGGLYFGNIINVTLEYRDIENDKSTALKQKAVPSLFEIKTTKPASIQDTVSSGSADTKARKPAGYSHEDPGMPYGNDFTDTVYPEQGIPAGNMYQDSNYRTNMSSENDNYPNYGSEEGAQDEGWNAYTTSEVSGTSLSAGDKDTSTAVPAGRTGLDLLGSAYGMDDETQENEQPADYSNSSAVPSGSAARPSPWSKYMNWTQADTTVTQSEQGAGNVGQNANRPGGILRNTSGGMVSKRNAAGFMDYAPQDLPDNRPIVIPIPNRSQGQANLSGVSNVQKMSTTRNAGRTTPSGERARQPAGILKKGPNVNIGNNVPVGQLGSNLNATAGSNSPRTRKTMWLEGVKGVPINTPSGVGILYGSAGQRTGTTGLGIGTDNSSRPTSSLKAIEGYLGGNQSATLNDSSSSTPSGNSRSPSEPPSSNSLSSLSQLGKKPRDGSWLQQYLNESHPFPVIGLDYITEYSNPYQSYASYKCALCDTFPQGMGIVTHLASHKHRLTYMERRLPTLFKKVESMNLSKSDLTAELTKHAREIERRNGRGKITMMTKEHELQRKIAEEEERQKKLAEEQEQMQKKAEEEERLRKIAEEEERLKMIAEELERQRKILEEKERQTKLAEEKARQKTLKKIEEDLEMQRKIEVEIERQKKIIEEKEKQRKLEAEKEKQIKITEEKEKQHKIAEDKEKQRKLAELKERLKRKEEEKENQRRKEEERQKKIAEERKRKLEEELEREQKIAKDLERQQKIAEELERQRKIAEELQRKIEERQRKEAEKLQLEKEAQIREQEEREKEEKEREELERKEKEKQKEASKVSFKITPVDGPTKTILDNTEDIVEQLKQEKRPIVGLDYITYQPNDLKPKMPFYKCFLCEVTSYMTLLVKHVTSYTHQMAYIKKFDSEVHQWIQFLPTRSKQRQRAEEKARDLEKHHGRGTLNLTGTVKAVSQSQDAMTSEKDKGSTQVQDMEMDSETEGPADIDIFEDDTDEIEDPSPQDTGEIADNNGLDPDSSKAKLFGMLKYKDDAPLVGLRYITEIQSFNDSVKYKCDLCDTEVVKGLIFTHLKGYRHKMAYIRENYPDTFSHVQDKLGSAEEFCRYIEKQKGREPINVIKAIPPKTPSDSVTYSDPIRVRPPGKCTEDARTTPSPVTIDRQTPTRTTPSPVLIESRTPTPPFRVITPPVSFVTPVSLLTGPPVIASTPIIPAPLIEPAPPVMASTPLVGSTPPVAAPAFLANSLNINVKSMTVTSNSDEPGQSSTSLQEVTMKSVSGMQVPPPPQPQPIMFSPFIPPPPIIRHPAIGVQPPLGVPPLGVPPASSVPPVLVQPSVGVLPSMGIPPRSGGLPPMRFPPPMAITPSSVQAPPISIASQPMGIQPPVGIRPPSGFLPPMGVPPPMTIRPPSVQAPPISIASQPMGIQPPMGIPPPSGVLPPMGVPPPMAITPPSVQAPPISIGSQSMGTQPVVGVPPPSVQALPTSIATQPVAEEKEKGTTVSSDTGMKVRKMKDYYDLVNEYQLKTDDTKILLGVSYVTEIEHPYDEEPPLFQCDLCKLSCTAKQIVSHMVTKTHQLEFFKKEYPILHTLLATSFGKHGKSQNQNLNQFSAQVESTHRQERVRRVIASDELPWKTWKNNNLSGRYARTQMAIKDGLELEASYKVAGDSTLDGQQPAKDKPVTDHHKQTTDRTARDDMLSTADPGTIGMRGPGLTSVTVSGVPSMADQPLQFERKKASIPAVNVRQGVAMSDIVGETEVDESKWKAVNTEIESRIQDKSIIVVEKPSRFLNTYKPFLDKFPVIGLESLTEFQKPDENLDPWYLCYLCHMEIDWKDIVDHVVTLLHRAKYIEKEHPKLHELLTTSFFKNRKELKEKIEEFSKGVAKPPTELSVKVMMELAVTQDQLNAAMKGADKDISTTIKEQEELKKGEPMQIDEEPVETEQESERTLEQKRKQPRIVFHHNHGKPEMTPIVKDYQHAAPVVKDYRHGSLPKSTEKKESEKLKAKLPELFGVKTQRAILGLDHVTEYQPVDSSSELEYACGLCDVQLGTDTIMQHLMSQKHRFTFFSKYSPEVYVKLTEKSSGRPMSRSEVNTLTEQYALEYEQKHGRREVKVVLGQPEEERGVRGKTSKRSMNEAEDESLKKKLQSVLASDESVKTDNESLKKKLQSVLASGESVESEKDKLRKKLQTVLASQGQVESEDRMSVPVKKRELSTSINSSSAKHVQEPSVACSSSAVQYSVQSVSGISTQHQQTAVSSRPPVTGNFSSSQAVNNQSYSTANIPSSVTNISSQLPVSAHQLPIQTPLMNQQSSQHQQQNLQQQKQHQTQPHVQQSKPASDFGQLVQKQLEMLKQQQIDKQRKEDQQRLAFQPQISTVAPVSQPVIRPNLPTPVPQVIPAVAAVSQPVMRPNLTIPPQVSLQNFSSMPQYVGTQPAVHIPRPPVQIPRPPVQSQGIPFQSQGLPVSSQGIPFQSQGLPVSSQGIVPPILNQYAGPQIIQTSQGMTRQYQPNIQIQQGISQQGPPTGYGPSAMQPQGQPFVPVTQGFPNQIQPRVQGLVQPQGQPQRFPNQGQSLFQGQPNILHQAPTVIQAPQGMPGQQVHQQIGTNQSYGIPQQQNAVVRPVMQRPGLPQLVQPGNLPHSQMLSTSRPQVPQMNMSVNRSVIPIVPNVSSVTQSMQHSHTPVLTGVNANKAIKYVNKPPDIVMPKSDAFSEYLKRIQAWLKTGQNEKSKGSRFRRSLSTERDSSKTSRPKRAHSADRETKDYYRSDTRMAGDKERIVTRLKRANEHGHKSPEVDAEFDARNYRNANFAQTVLESSSKNSNTGKKKDMNKDKDIIDISSSESDFDDVADEFDAYKYRDNVESEKVEKSVKGSGKAGMKQRLAKSVENVHKGKKEQHFFEEFDSTKYIGKGFNKQSENLENKPSENLENKPSAIPSAQNKHHEERYRTEHDHSPHKIVKQRHSEGGDLQTKYLGKEFEKQSLDDSPTKKSLQIVKSGEVKTFDDFSITITRTRKGVQIHREEADNDSAGERHVYSHGNNITIKTTSDEPLEQNRESISETHSQAPSRSERIVYHDKNLKVRTESSSFARKDNDISEVRKRIQRELEKSDFDDSISEQSDERRVVRIGHASNKSDYQHKSEEALHDDISVHKVDSDVKLRQKRISEKYDKDLDIHEARKRIHEELSKLEADESSTNRYVSKADKTVDKGSKKHSESKKVANPSKDDLEDISDESDEWPNDGKKSENMSGGLLKSSEFETIDSDSDIEESFEKFEEENKSSVEMAASKDRNSENETSDKTPNYIKEALKVSIDSKTISTETAQSYKEYIDFNEPKNIETASKTKAVSSFEKEKDSNIEKTLATNYENIDSDSKPEFEKEKGSNIEKMLATNYENIDSDSEPEFTGQTKTEENYEVIDSDSEHESTELPKEGDKGDIIDISDNELEVEDEDYSEVIDYVGNEMITVDMIEEGSSEKDNSEKMQHNASVSERGVSGSSTRETKINLTSRDNVRTGNEKKTSLFDRKLPKYSSYVFIEEEKTNDPVSMANNNVVKSMRPSSSFDKKHPKYSSLQTENKRDGDPESSRHSSQNSGDVDFQAVMDSMGDNFVTVDDLGQNDDPSCEPQHDNYVPHDPLEVENEDNNERKPNDESFVSVDNLKAVDSEKSLERDIMETNDEDYNDENFVTVDDAELDGDENDRHWTDSDIVPEQDAHEDGGDGEEDNFIDVDEVVGEGSDMGSDNGEFMDMGDDDFVDVDEYRENSESENEGDNVDMSEFVILDEDDNVDDVTSRTITVGEVSGKETSESGPRSRFSGSHGTHRRKEMSSDRRRHEYRHGERSGTETTKHQTGSRLRDRSSHGHTSTRQSGKTDRSMEYLGMPFQRHRDDGRREKRSSSRSQSRTRSPRTHTSGSGSKPCAESRSRNSKTSENRSHHYHESHRSHPDSYHKESRSHSQHSKSHDLHPWPHPEDNRSEHSFHEGSGSFSPYHRHSRSQTPCHGESRSHHESSSHKRVSHSPYSTEMRSDRESQTHYEESRSHRHYEESSSHGHYEKSRSHEHHEERSHGNNEDSSHGHYKESKLQEHNEEETSFQDYIEQFEMEQNPDDDVSDRSFTETWSEEDNVNPDHYSQEAYRSTGSHGALGVSRGRGRGHQMRGRGAFGRGRRAGRRGRGRGRGNRIR